MPRLDEYLEVAELSLRQAVPHASHHADDDEVVARKTRVREIVLWGNNRENS